MIDRPTEPGEISGVVFDLDGVLVDSEIWWDDVRKAWAAQQGRAWTDDDRRAVMGANSRQWSQTMRERLRLALPPEAIEAAIVERVVARFGTVAGLKGREHLREALRTRGFELR